MSEKFPGHGIVGPMGGPGPAAPDEIISAKIFRPKYTPNNFPILSTQRIAARPGSHFIYTDKMCARTEFSPLIDLKCIIDTF